MNLVVSQSRIVAYASIGSVQRMGVLGLLSADPICVLVALVMCVSPPVRPKTYLSNVHGARTITATTSPIVSRSIRIRNVERWTMRREGHPKNAGLRFMPIGVGCHDVR